MLQDTVLTLLLWYPSCFLALSFCLPIIFLFSPFHPHWYKETGPVSSAFRWDQLGPCKVISGWEWVQFCEPENDREPSLQQINVDTNYEMRLVIDFRLSFCPCLLSFVSRLTQLSSHSIPKLVNHSDSSVRAVCFSRFIVISSCSLCGRKPE